MIARYPRTVLGLLAFAVLAVSFVAPGSAAAAPATAWQIKQGSDPTALPPAGTSEQAHYHLRITNVGGQTAPSGMTITQTISPGVTPVVRGFGPEADVPNNSKFRYPCTISGQQVTCEVKNAEILAGAQIEVLVPVEVEADPPPSVTSEVSVSSPGVAPVFSTLQSSIGDSAPFSFVSGPLGLSGSAFDEVGSTPTAGSHPFDVQLSAHVSTVINESGLRVSDPLKTLNLELPAGLVANPLAVKERCTLAEMQGSVAENPVTTCPTASQVGLIHFSIIGGLEGLASPLIDMVPPPGIPAEFAFVINGTIIHIRGGLSGNFRLTAGSKELLAKFPIPGVKVDLWGVPSDQRHDAQRSEGGCTGEGCAIEPSRVPFLTMPTSCTQPMRLDGTASGWGGSETADSRLFENLEGEPAGLSGCNQLSFEPTLEAVATTNAADSPTGLEFDLHQPQPQPAETVGTIEECSPGTWEGAQKKYEFAWLRNGAPIVGAEFRTYELQEADSGTSLQCQVTAINGTGSTRAVSQPRSIGAPLSPPPVPGTPKVEVSTNGGGEEEAVCAPGNWSEGTTLEYAWFENGLAVPGQSGERYLPVLSPVTVQCEVVGSNEGGTVVAFSRQQSLPASPATQYPNFSARPQFGVSAPNIPRSAANLKTTKVTLPAGLTLNPSSGTGLEACTEEEMGYAPAEGKVLFKTTSQTCPPASKIGTVEVTTPLLGEPQPGAVYVAKPFDNPFGTLLALYIVLEDEETGIIAKLGGKVEADPVTGQLTTTFDESPDLPLEDIKLHLFNGPGATLTTPLTCGQQTTTSTLTPWSTPEGADVHPTSSFETSNGCYASEAAAPREVAFTAGTASPLSGAYSPFILRLARGDGTQHITGIETTLPEGLTGKLAGVPYCPEADIAQARSREVPNKGKEEQQSPSCPALSEIGTVKVTAGSGITPFPVAGHAYLAGPYKGAPLSMVVIVPAVAGPFDFGAVVSRVALYVGEYDARIHAIADPLPTIRDGIPLDVRTIELRLDRPSFTINPTSCEMMAIGGSVTMQTGQTTSLNNRFQVGECKRLAFKPNLAISLKGGTKRTAHPALKAVVTYPKGGEYANIASAQVGLPHGEFLDNANIGAVCTQPQLKSQTCPAKSIYGKVKAWTPLLGAPLEGPVYLGTGFGHKLPDLVAELNGQIRVLLHGKVDTDKQKGIRNTFEAAPDAPIEKFVLEMKGGKKYGLLVNSENICKKKQVAEALFTAQNGKTLKLSPTIANSCKGEGGKKKKGHAKK